MMLISTISITPASAIISAIAFMMSDLPEPRRSRRDARIDGLDESDFGVVDLQHKTTQPPHTCTSDTPTSTNHVVMRYGDSSSRMTRAFRGFFVSSTC